MRVGFLGVAHIHAHQYAEVLNKVAEIGGVWDRDPERAENFVRLYGGKTVYEPSQLAELSDTLIIASETIFHPQDVDVALELGLPTLCEKPLATCVKDAAKIADSVRKKGLLFGVAFPCRFLSVFKRLKERFSRGEFGDVLAIYGRNRGKQPGGWFRDARLSGGGALMDHIVHLVDLARWLTSQEPTKAYALTSRRDTSLTVEDVGLVALQFSGGLVMTLDCSWSRPREYPFWGDVVMKLVTTEATIEVDGFGQTVSLFGEGPGLHRSVFWGEDMNRQMLETFLRSVKAGKLLSPLAGSEDGYQAQRVVEASYRSARSGKPERV